MHTKLYFGCLTPSPPKICIIYKFLFIILRIANENIQLDPKPPSPKILVQLRLCIHTLPFKKKMVIFFHHKTNVELEI